VKIFKMLSFIMAAVLCMTAFSVTAFASESEVTADSEDAAETEFIIDLDDLDLGDIDLGEDVDLDAILDFVGGMIASGDITATDGMPLTPGGNLTLIDDILQIGGKEAETENLPEKQFITLQSKNGNYFYLVIDRSGETENVYFMNLVDEADLMALIEEAKGESDTTVETEPAKCSCEDKCELGAVNGKCAICRINYTDCIGKIVPIEPTDTEDTDSKSNSGTVIVVILVLAIAAGVGVYFFKFRKPKDGKSVPDLDDYDSDGDEDDTDEAEPDDVDEEDETGETDEGGENE